MTAILPKKHPTGGQKLRKSNRVYPRYDPDEEELRKRKSKNQKTWFGQQGQQNKGQPLQAQPQGGWTAQPAQQPEQPQLPPVGNLWRAIVIIIMAILAFIVLYHMIAYILPDIVGGSGGSGGNSAGCPTDCGPAGVGVTVASQCACPTACKNYFIITSSYMKGYKQCHR